MEETKNETPEGETKENMVERAEKAVAKLLEVEERLNKTRESFQQEQAEALLSGSANAGTASEAPPKEETPQEYMQKVMRNEL